MSTSRVIVAATILFPVLLLAQEREARIHRSDLPPAVEKAVVEQSKGATIRAFSKEQENGQTFYEAELIVDGHSKDVLVDWRGSVVEVEEQVSLESLPAEVREGLRDRAGNGKLGKVETITKKDRVAAYEAKVVTNGKKSEVRVGPDGRSLDHEE